MLARGDPARAPCGQLLCAFLLAHLLALTPSFWLTRSEAFGYITAFVLGLAVRLWHQPLACLATLTGVYLIAYEGLRRSMAAIPLGWPKLPNPERGRRAPATSLARPADGPTTE